MKRRSKAGGKASKARGREALKTKRRDAPKTASSSAPTQDAEVARLTRELNEALERQTATSEVLEVISGSPGDLQPVFAAMLENAVRICDAKFGNIYRRDGEALHLVAAHNTPPAFVEARRSTPFFSPGPKSVVGRMVATKTVIHVADLAAEQAYIKDRIPSAVAAVELGGVRTILAVPMLNKSELIGSFTVYRQEVRPFTDKQIALVTNFAAQAVIAIENARLLNELREALEQQTATSEVLQVISSSPGELEPVFQAMLENATRICEAKFGLLLRFDGDAFHMAASVGTPPELSEFLWRRGAFQPVTGSHLDRLTRTKQVSHTADYAAEGVPSPPVTLGGARSTVDVPMLKDDELIGAFSIYRQEVRPFSEKQIELVKNFAAQAVIAIENARLLNELRQRTSDLTEALQQQIATSDVLGIISSSQSDLQPVFRTILENATRICEAKFGFVHRYDGQLFQPSAQVGAPEELVEFPRKRGPFRPEAGSMLDRIIHTKQVGHTPDITAENFPVAAAKIAGARSTMAVPMLKDRTLLGALVIYRQEVRPFTDKQIALVTNFAAQAVIAIENARLLDELRQRTDDLTERTADLTEALGRGTHSDPLDNDRDESERGDIVTGQAVVSCCQASPVLETAEEAFDKVATPIYGAIERVRNCSRCGGWNNSLDATGFEPVTQAVRVISFICDQVFRQRDGTQQRHGHADVGNVAGRQREGDRPAAIIGQTMDFRGATAARAPDRLRPLPPFAPAAERCAFTCELSRLSSRGTSPEAAICSNRRCQSPRCDHLL